MSSENDGISVPDLAQDIVSRSETLLQEMDQLRQRYYTVKGSHQNIPGLASLIDAVRQEQKSARLFLIPRAHDQADPSPDKNGSVEAHPADVRLRFTNIPAIERNWDIVKRCRNLVSVEQSIPKVPRVGVRENGGLIVHRKGPGKSKRGTDMAFVHAVVDGGAEWLRIVNKDERRIMMELAAGGWDWDWESDDEDADEEDDADLFEDIPLLRTAKELADTARQYWNDYRRPRIRILLTRVEDAQGKELDRVIQKMRRAGGDDITITVECADAAWVSPDSQQGIDTAVINLVPAGISGLGSTVLLDTSVMIAMASDLSHSSVEVQPWHSIDCKTQIQDEANGINFLRLQAYPPLRGRRLVCTKEALGHFREITSTIGSPTELERARILLAGGREELQELSAYPVPDDLMLPVQVLDEETDLHAQDLVDKDELPAVAVQIEKHLLGVPGNRATHLYGWWSGIAVVTSNRSLANKMVRMVESSLDEDYEDGPRIFPLPYNRALSTKGPKQRG
ncbi:hypothetical protein VP1G_05854 [Cytospora mali]|uniref:DUF1308 domain-containing protein n=1 Tax=Cytospora mali TaxID=578113 RepID=A0A194V3S9_CYTMA|nr:hypothetical protein VP1G_05854 [Valsa mali var. pyri (nom. inval.)]